MPTFLFFIFIDFLEATDTWINPSEKAIQDTNGESQGRNYEGRLRIRKVERMLLTELEMNIRNVDLPVYDVNSFSNSVDNNSIVDNNSTRNISWSTLELLKFDEKEKHQLDLLSWKLQAAIQLKNIQKLQGEKLHSTSTNRMSNAIPISVNNSPKVAHPHMPLAEPTKLNDFSTLVASDNYATTFSSTFSPHISSNTSHSRPTTSEGSKHER